MSRHIKIWDDHDAEGGPKVRIQEFGTEDPLSLLLTPETAKDWAKGLLRAAELPSDHKDACDFCERRREKE